MPRKKVEEDPDSDIEFIPNIRKSARLATKGENTPSRTNSATSESGAPAPTPARRTKKSESVEPEMNAALTPSRRTSARLSHSDKPGELLELPTPMRRRTSSTSSNTSTTTPRRATRAAVNVLPVLPENDAVEEALSTPPAEEVSPALIAEVPPSAQKRHANLASKLIKMLDTPEKNPKTVLEVVEEVVVVPESPKKAAASPAKSPTKRDESPAKKPASPKKESPAKSTPKKTVEEQDEEEPMDWEEGPQKTPIIFRSAAKQRLQQLAPDATETPTSRAARRGRPSSAVIFGEEKEEEEEEKEVSDVVPASPVKQASASPPKSPEKALESPVKADKVSPVKKAADSPKKSPVKAVVEEAAEQEEVVLLPTSPAKKTTVVSPKKAASPKKSPVKVVEEEEEEEGGGEEEEEEDDKEEEASDEEPIEEDEDETGDDEAGDEEDEEEDMEDEDDQGEEEEEAVEVVVSPKKKAGKVQEVVEEEEEEEDEDEDEEEEMADEDEEDAVDGLFPAVSFKKVFDQSVDFSAALQSVYAWAFARGSSRHDDLPGKLVAPGIAETVWQQIEHRSAQIAKDCKKAKKAGLLEKDIALTEDDEEKEKKKKKRDVEEEEEDEEMEDEAEFDDEDLLMDEEEDDEQEEEEEGNLFDMTPEQLARLDEDLKALEGEDDDEEEEEERPKKKQKGKKEEGEKKKKFPKSMVDDRFFSLAEMEAAADAMEKDGAIEEGILDDEEDGDAAYTYDEFFGADDDDVFGGKKDKKQKKKMAAEEEDDSALPQSKKKSKESRKSVSWAEGDKLKEERLIEPTGKMRRLTAAALHGEEEEEEEEEEKMDGGEVEEEERILLGPADDEKEAEEKTPLKGSIKSIKKRIAQLEEENLEARKWDLQGEVGGAQRGENTLLEQHVEFDHGMAKAPTITEDFNAKIEAIVLQRFKDKAWDDPVRTVRQEERTEEYRSKLVEEDLLIKQSLSSVYEKEYEKAQEGADAAASGQPVVNPKHAEIEEAWSELFGLIDPLFHFNVTPQQAKAEIKVLTNMRALQQEEVGAMMSTEEMLIAPEEVKRSEKGDLKGKEERDSTDKKRERRKKKQKQRAVVLTRGEDGLKRMLEKKADEAADENGEPKKKKKKKTGDAAAAPKAAGGTGGGKFKSTDFFTKLQATVQNELVEKTKKTKVKAASKGNSAKFKL